MRTSLELLLKRPVCRPHSLLPFLPLILAPRSQLEHLTFYNDMLGRIKAMFPRSDDLNEAWELWDQLHEGSKRAH